jgi:hypothetical protein
LTRPARLQSPVLIIVCNRSHTGIASIYSRTQSIDEASRGDIVESVTDGACARIRNAAFMAL